MRVQYLGVGGFLVSRGREDVLLTAPLYSNPSLVEYLLDHDLRPDTDLIDRFLPEDAAQARAILSGHSHYDHLLDAPYVALHHAKKAAIYASRTTDHLLARLRGSFPGGDVVPLDELAWDNGREAPGQWIQLTSRLRFTAIRSEHADQAVLSVPFGSAVPFHLARGKVHDDLEALPQRGSQWAEGTVFAFVIDFLDDRGGIAFRIYYQDSGTNPPQGFIPSALLPPYPDGRHADLAILCVGGEFRRLDRHPERIIANTRPRYVLLAHWEDFFVPQTAYCVEGRINALPSAKASFFGRTHTGDFVKRVRRAISAEHLDTQVWLPCPTLSTFEFPVAGSAKLATGKADPSRAPFSCPVADPGAR